MCGILGNFGHIERQDFLDHIKESTYLMTRRGPDQTNFIDIENFYAVHSRLIVQGNFEDGTQPITYKNIVLLFNGNLYNKESLKAELKSLGYVFKGVSDTEVVILSIYHWGNDAFSKFNGFFSVAYFNSDKKSLTLARDRLGQKPLYYLSNGQSVFFGSTEALVPKKYYGSIRKESLIDFITFGFLPAPNTMIENLKSVEPGNFINFSFTEGKVTSGETHTYWRPIISNEIENSNTAIELISNALEHSMKEGMEASIDVACLFSGGVDSSLIFSNARSKNNSLCAFTADFGEFDDADDRSISLATALGHDNHIVKHIAQTDVDSSINLTSKICESPFDDTSIIPSNIIFSSVKEARYSVALTGDGADELFCGYSSFGNLYKLERFLDKKFDFLLRHPGKIFRGLLSKFKHYDLERIFMKENDLLIDLSCNGFKKREWENLIDSDYDPFHYLNTILKDLDGLRPLDKLRILNLKFKLPYQMLYKVDRASMYNSVEARPLFLNNKIVDAALKISSSVMLAEGQKTILKKIYQNQIPHSGWSLPKTGFGWKTDNYQNIYTDKANNYMINRTGINGLSLLESRKRHHKRGYYGLFSLVSWLRNHEKT